MMRTEVVAVPASSRGFHEQVLDAPVSDVSSRAQERASADEACQVPMRLDLEMKSFLRATLVLLWVWFVLCFGPKSKR